MEMLFLIYCSSDLIGAETFPVVYHSSTTAYDKNADVIINDKFNNR